MEKQIKILLIEDEPDVRKTVKGILSKLDYEIKEAKSGEKALEFLSKADYDAIILDIKLPGMSGIQMLDKAKTDLINLPPVVVLTEHGNSGFSQWGIFEYFPKYDLDKTDLFKSIIINAVNYKQKLNSVKAKYCLKQHSCDISINIPTNLVFVGIAFRRNKVYEQGIKPIVESFNFECWRADKLHKTKDFSCKICALIQGCQFAIFDVTGLRPNVLLELGFAYASGKDVFILKHRKEELPEDLKGLELVEYTTISSLKEELGIYLRNYMIDKNHK